jgi:hypothetical protein
VGEAGEETLAQILEVLAIGFPDFAQEEALEAGLALAIVGADLGKEPVGFATAPSAAIADGLGPVGPVTEPGDSARGELAGLQDQTSLGEVQQLVAGTALFEADLEEARELRLS